MPGFSYEKQRNYNSYLFYKNKFLSNSKYQDLSEEDLEIISGYIEHKKLMGSMFKNNF